MLPINLLKYYVVIKNKILFTTFLLYAFILLVKIITSKIS